MTPWLSASLRLGRADAVRDARALTFGQALALRVGCAMLALVPLLAGCTSVKQIGVLGPKELPIWKVSQDDWLASSRMLIILDKEGNLLAATGGTTAGVVPVGVGAAQAAATAAAGVLIGKGLHELSHVDGTVKGTIGLTGTVHAVP